MNESRKAEIQALEAELLTYEADFSSGKSVDVAKIVVKARQLTALTEAQAFQEGVEEGITEGLKAGLVLQSVKKRQEQKENSTVPPEKMRNPSPHMEKGAHLLKGRDLEGLLQAKDSLKDSVASTFSSLKENAEKIQKLPPSEMPIQKESLGTENQDFQWEETVFHQRDRESPQEKQKSSRDWSELNLGKYIMGILAAILALTGTALLGALSWQYLSDPVKALLMGSVGSVMVALPTMYIQKHGEEVKNGFLTSVMGAGLSILYMTVLFLGIWWKLIGETPMLLGLIALIYITAYLAHHIHSSTLLVVSYIGNIGTFLLLFTKMLTITQLYIAITSLLVTASLLIVYTLKSDWTNALTKSLSIVLGGLVMVASTGNVMVNYGYATYSFENLPKFSELSSPYFWIYAICFLFAFALGVLLGCGGSRLDEFGLYENSDEKKNQEKFIHGSLLLLAYMSFSTLFYYVPEWFLLLIASTFLLNKSKELPALLSMPYVLGGLHELAKGRVGALLHLNVEDSRFLVLFLVLCLFVLGMYFLVEKENRVSLLLVKWGYGLAWVCYFLELQSKHATMSNLLLIPILACCGLYFCRGVQKTEENEEEWDAVCDLLYYIPAILLLGNQIDGSISSLYSVIPSVTLISVAVLKIGEKLLPPLQALETHFLYKLSLEAMQILGFMWISGQVGGKYVTVTIHWWILTALLLILVESFYHLIRGEFVHSVLKYKYMLSIPMVFHALSYLVFLGDVAVVSSVILICSGSLSIFLGFRHRDQSLRQLGLAMSILSVLKMVIFDVSDSDSITRVLAMIFGAVLCFGISHVYNKLED